MGNSFIALLADWMRLVAASTMEFRHEVVWFVDLDSLWMRRASPPTSGFGHALGFIHELCSGMVALAAALAACSF